MPNSYFQFKQFTVQQEKTAMKVCTDACLFGGWAANEIEKGKVESERVLDIGTGTGLLSLMLAQKTNAVIDAVEVDDAAAQQAAENFEASAWRDRLSVHRSSVQEFSTLVNQKYDIIISNPPFFKSSLKSDNLRKNLAKHTPSLAFEELAGIVSNLLKPEGVFYLLLPCFEFQVFIEVARQQNLFLHKLVNVQQTPAHPYFRTMGAFAKQEVPEVEPHRIIIKDAPNQYSEDFIQFLKDYYLYL
jgi:tRNA1Val (adenine37-N6)-methyltransferase